MLVGWRVSAAVSGILRVASIAEKVLPVLGNAIVCELHVTCVVHNPYSQMLPRWQLQLMFVIRADCALHPVLGFLARWHSVVIQVVSEAEGLVSFGSGLAKHTF